MCEILEIIWEIVWKNKNNTKALNEPSEMHLTYRIEF